MTSPAIELGSAPGGGEIPDLGELGLALDLDYVNSFGDVDDPCAPRRPTQGTSSDLAIRVAAVRAQLAPIHSQSALLESYRREALCLLTPTRGPLGAAAEALEIAYALRWLELEGSARREVALR